MRFYLPEGISHNVAEWGKGERSARIAYVANFISTRRYGDEGGSAIIHSPTIKKTISSEAWQNARIALSPYLEIESSYQKGNFSKTYRWIDSLESGKFVTVVIYCPGLIKRIAILRKQRIEQFNPVETRLYRDLLALTCDIDDIDGFLTALPPKPGTKNESLRMAYYESSIREIHDHSLEIGNRCPNGRMYHGLTRTPRLVRARLKLDGEEVAEVDLANSQPYFMASLFPDVPGLAESVSEGTFYADVNRHQNSPFDLENPVQKSELKRLSLMCLYAKPNDRKNWNRNPDSKSAVLDKAMEVAFPGLLGRITDYARQHGKTALANAMQSQESKIFIGAVLPELQKRCIPAIPIHDSILCRRRDAREVKELIGEELLKATNIKPTVKGSEPEQATPGFHHAPHLHPDHSGSLGTIGCPGALERRHVRHPAMLAGKWVRTYGAWRSKQLPAQTSKLTFHSDPKELLTCS